MRFLVLGAGAIGGYFGGRLIEGGADVTFLVRERRLAQLDKSGLQIRSVIGDFDTSVTALSAADASREQWDVVLVACKAYDLQPAIDTLRLVVGEKTAILPFLNGLAHLDKLNAAFGSGRVLGGLAKIAATLTGDGVIQHLNDWKAVTLGEQDGPITDRVSRIKEAFDRTSVDVAASTNIMQMMWEKFVHLMTVAGMTTLMRSSIGEIAKSPGGSELLIQLLNLNAEVAYREGFPVRPEFLAEFNKLFKDTSSGYKASMLRDMENGGRTEADHIIRHMMQLAQKHDLDSVMHRLMYANLKCHEARL